MCGPCSISSRECLYASVGTRSSTGSNGLAQPAQRRPSTGTSHRRILPGRHEAIVTDDGSPNLTHTTASLDGVSLQSDRAQHASPAHVHAGLEEPGNESTTTGVEELGGHVSFDDASHIPNVYNTPDTIISEFLTTNLASTRWLDLLATDAAQADKGFSLPPTRHPTPIPGDLNFEYNAAHLDLRESNATVSQVQVQVPAQTGLIESRSSELTRLTQVLQDGVASIANERHAWQLELNICLQDHEVELFRMFTERAAQWLDLFDPLKHFSTHATRLAVRLDTNRLSLCIIKGIFFLTLVLEISSYGIWAS